MNLNLTRKQISAIVGAGIAGILLLVIAWVALYQPQLNSISAAHEKAAAQRVTVKQLESKLADLKAKASNISTAEADAQTVYDQFPTTSDQASWISMMKNAASSSHVTADAISPSVPTLGDAAGAGATGATGTGAATTPAPATTTAPAASTTPAATGAVGATSSPSSTTSTPSNATSTPNLATIAVTLSVTGASGDIDTFLKKVENLDQPLLIKAFSVSGSDSKLTASISGETYLSREIPVPALAAKK